MKDSDTIIQELVNHTDKLINFLEPFRKETVTESAWAKLVSYDTKVISSDFPMSPEENDKCHELFDNVCQFIMDNYPSGLDVVSIPNDWKIDPSKTIEDNLKALPSSAVPAIVMNYLLGTKKYPISSFRSKNWGPLVKMSGDRWNIWS